MIIFRNAETALLLYSILSAYFLLYRP